MYSPDAIADHALLTVSAWQRSSQEQANQLLAMWQARRILPPAMRLADCPPLVPAEDEEYERDLDVLREVLAS